MVTTILVLSLNKPYFESMCPPFTNSNLRTNVKLELFFSQLLIPLKSLQFSQCDKVIQVRNVKNTFIIDVTKFWM